MKYTRFTALWLCVFFLFCCVGCTPDPVTPSDVSSSLPPVTQTDEVSTPQSPRELTLSYEKAWSWNDLHDYLENPLQSGEFSFSPDKGETLVLLDTDGVTRLTDWKVSIKTGMTVEKYDARGGLLARYTVTLTGQPESSLEESSKEISKEEEPSSSSQEPSHTSSKDTPSKDTYSKPEEKVTLTLAAGKNSAGIKMAVEAFNQQSKTATIRLVEADLFTAARLEASIKDNTAPDVVLLDREEMTVAANRGLLVGLTDLKTPAESFDPVVWKNSLVKGRRYGLPMGCVTAAMACNDEVLYRCSLEPPETYAQLMDGAKTVQSTLSGITPLGLVTDPADYENFTAQFTLLLWNNGGELLTEDNQAPAFHSLAGIETLKLYQQWQQQSLIGENDTGADFLSGNAAYGIVPCTDYSQTFGNRAKENFTALPLMLSATRETVSYLELFSYCVTATGDKNRQKAAREFLDFYFSHTDYSLSDCKTRDMIPAVKEAREDKYYQTEAWQVFMDAIPTARTFPSVDFLDTLGGYLGQAITGAMAGEDLDELLKKAAEKTENRLQRQ